MDFWVGINELLKDLQNSHYCAFKVLGGAVWEKDVTTVDHLIYKRQWTDIGTGKQKHSEYYRKWNKQV